jgi:hypothetical protein
VTIALRNPSPPSPDEFKRAVLALQSSVDDQIQILGRWWNGSVELREGEGVRTYFMHPQESAPDFCRRVCRTEPTCDALVLEAVATAGRHPAVQA